MFFVTFFEDFTVLKKIGKGKYAKVYKVKRKNSIDENYYAVKFLCKRPSETIQNQVEAVMNEILILRQLEHENCIKLYQVYEDNEGYYLVFDLLDFENTIQKQIDKIEDPKQLQEFIKEIMRQILNGLIYLHSKQIMHRDIKLQNIMLQNNENSFIVKIIDFGFAQFINKKYIFVHVGTPGYVAPEILQNQQDNNRYNEKCDMFSLGILFHLLLTGQHIFTGQQFIQILQKNKDLITLKQIVCF
ncbi:protein kinase domain protein [Ichthyophthirius multifiliis]|uniref:Protein kinase domain protein n=1 Tax=Ichthyophthirius multifiliis TaxID=5932 RepID=G0QWW0_ICHMU|nr:protein kinase domain protein [Ichthyophthirius multifiliis]EGR30302.1 protein kinase domain protein [Ichthyophthirius multifiliis]|eukprot:XP_004031889.1 protein kinase domain protein [Ichthyophthirius multifiliis]